MSKHQGAPTRAPKSTRPKTNKKAKSHKADGTPKKRWTAAERAERGRGPRRSGGRNRAERRREEFGKDRWSAERKEIRPSRFEASPSRSERATTTDERRGGTDRRSDRKRPDNARDDRFRRDRNDRKWSDSTRDDRSRRDRDDRRTPRTDRRDVPRNRPAMERTERFDRDDHGAESADTMSWTAAQLEVDESSVSADSSFAAMGLPRPLVAALQAGGITTPFPIQAATIPDALAGRDVLGRGQTGSGKTLGFGLPMLTRIAARQLTGRRSPRGIVLVPTRELALQVADVLAPLASTVGLSVILVAGGMSYTPQIRAFERGVDVVVATPGRLIDLLDQGAVDLSAIEVTVLDEADHMADLGFMPAVTTILDAVPADGQRLLFSATLDHAVDRLVRGYLVDPITHEVDSDRASVTTMEHRVIHVHPHDKVSLTAEIAGRPGRTVLFVRTQRGADRVAEQLRTAGVMAGALHGGLTQGARSRILAAFKDGTLPVLVATDVAARGIHVDEVGLVLQVDPPAGPKEYLHRAGRTARAGGTGVVVSLALPHQRREVTRLTARAGVKPVATEVRPGDEQLAAATGARHPSGVPISEQDYQRLIAPPARGGRPRGRKDFSRPDGRGTRRGGRGYGRGQGGRPNGRGGHGRDSGGRGSSGRADGRRGGREHGVGAR